MPFVRVPTFGRERDQKVKDGHVGATFPPEKGAGRMLMAVVIPTVRTGEEAALGLHGKRLLAARATSGVGVLKILRNAFVPTRRVDLCLPSKSLE